MEAELGHRAEVRDFLAATLPPDWQGFGALDRTERARFRATWRAALVSSGYLVPAWPRRYGGRDAGVTEQMVVAEEFVRAGVPHLPGPNDPFGLLMLGPTLLRHGSEWQRERFLPPTVTGEIAWAQGYSEPEAGSDLFALRTRGERTAAGWRITGQKVWQTAGLTADWLFALVRTDAAAHKSRGLSFVLIPLAAPGVEVRGIRNIVGEEEFAEVFLSGVEIPDENMVGEPGQGAAVALALLGYERGFGGFTNSLSYRVELDRLVHLGRQRGVLSDQRIRERVARCATTVHVINCLSRAVLADVRAGRDPGPESSLIKLMSAEHRQRVTGLALDILGEEVLVPSGDIGPAAIGAQPLGTDTGSGAAWVRDYLQSRPGTVYGGSSQIQRNTIAEQILGLPRESR